MAEFLDTLTRREREVLRLILQGYKDDELANSLGITRHSMKRHRANLIKKLRSIDLEELKQQLKTELTKI